MQLDNMDKTQAIGMLMEIPGGTQKQYDDVMAMLDLEKNPPRGGMMHVAGPMEGGWRVFDVWESQEALDAFFQERLGAALQKAGVPSAKPKVFKVHTMMH
jgi:hypothetical protein